MHVLMPALSSRIHSRVDGSLSLLTFYSNMLITTVAAVVFETVFVGYLYCVQMLIFLNHFLRSELSREDKEACQIIDRLFLFRQQTMVVYPLKRNRVITHSPELRMADIDSDIPAHSDMLFAFRTDDNIIHGIVSSKTFIMVSFFLTASPANNIFFALQFGQSKEGSRNFGLIFACFCTFGHNSLNFAKS